MHKMTDPSLILQAPAGRISEKFCMKGHCTHRKNQTGMLPKKPGPAVIMDTGRPGTGPREISGNDVVSSPEGDTQ